MLSSKDYYDKKGRLLLAKGQEISDHILEKLKYYLKEDLENTNKGLNTEEITRKLNPVKKNILDYPADILNKIIFESKSKPWWILINSFSNYDYWKYTHSVNVALMSLLVAINMGYDIPHLWDLGLGALLHDIGNILIPKSIMLKKGLLTDQEMEFVKQHCELGLSMSHEYNLPKNITDIILYHHERNDGSGYPHGLREPDIPNNVKIVMVADVIDALSSFRPYRPAKEISEAFKMLYDDREKFSIDIVMILEQLIKKT
jgi:putative nucleotidyltransferase with HDIG domain